MAEPWQRGLASPQGPSPCSHHGLASPATLLRDPGHCQGSPAPPVPAPRQGDEAQHRRRGNPSTDGPRPSKGPLSPSPWHCSCPSSVEHRGRRNEPLHAPRAGQARGGAGNPSVSRLAAVLGRLQSPARGCKLVAGVKGSRRCPEGDGAGREASDPGGTAPLQLSPADAHSPGTGSAGWGAGGAALAPPRSRAQPQRPHSGAGGPLVPCPCGQCCCLGFSAHSLPAHGGAQQRGREHGARAACSTATCPKAARSSVGSRAGGLRAGRAPRVSLILAAPSPWRQWHPAPRARASSRMLPPSTTAWSPAPGAAEGPTVGEGHRGRHDRQHPDRSLRQARCAQHPGDT